MTWVGIDPGRTGGIGIVREDGTGEAVALPYNDGKLDVHGALAALPSPPFRVFIEEQNPRPGNAARTTATMMANYGRLLGALEYAEIGYRTTTPKTWKGRLGLSGKAKEASVALANRLFGLRLLKSHDGKAEGLLIAEWGRRHG